MKLELQITRCNPNGLGLNGMAAIILFNEKDELMMNRCYMTSLENEDKKIPSGKYDLKITYSPRFNRKLIQVMNVTGRSGIRIHPFNKASESQGCITVGLPANPTGTSLMHTRIHCDFLQELVALCSKATLIIQ